MHTKNAIPINLEPFKPVWWAWNTHVHTIVASQFTKVDKPECVRLEIPTPDQDFLEIDTCIQDNDQPIVALFHGLEGSTNRYYIANLMMELKNIGYSSAALNFRGCGSRMNNRPRFYHSGETDDYRTFFSWIRAHYPDKKIYAVGYSLGANALVKYLAEEGSDSIPTRAVAVSPPFDLKAGSISLHKGFNRVYEQNFLKSLVRKLEEKQKKFPEMPAFSGNSMYEFDNQITAVLHHFKNADDYYRRCSSRYFFEEVATELLIISSKKDPLCPIKFAPINILEQNPCIQTCFTETGGHVGFLSRPKGWMFRVIIKWLGRD